MSTSETSSRLTALQQNLQRIVDAAVADKQNGLPALTFGTLFRDKETGAWQRVWASAGQLPLLQDNAKVNGTLVGRSPRDSSTRFSRRST